MGGGGDDLDSGDLFDELEAAEARLALEKTRERIERLRSGRGFRNDEDEIQRRQFIESRIEQLQSEEHEELQRLAEEDVSQRNPYTTSHYWLTKINNDGQKDRIAEVKEQRRNWPIAETTHEIPADDERTSTEHEDKLEYLQSEEEGTGEYDSDDERLLMRHLGGASTIRKQFAHVLKKQGGGKATALAAYQSVKQDVETETSSKALGNNGLINGSPKWRERLLTSAETEGVSPADTNDAVESIPDRQSTKEPVRNTEDLSTSGEVADAVHEYSTPLAKRELDGFESELQLPSFDEVEREVLLQLPSFDEVERELIQNRELPSSERLMPEVDSCGNGPIRGIGLIEADRACDEIDAQPTGRRRKGLFSRRVEEVTDNSAIQAVTSSSSCDAVADSNTEVDIGPLVAQPSVTGVPGMGDLLLAIDRELQQDVPNVDSRDLFFQLGKMKKGDWSSSDEELSDREAARSVLQPVFQESQAELSASASDEEGQANANTEESQKSEQDRPGRFIHSSLTAMQARQKRKEQLRETTKQRYAEAFSAAVCQSHRGRTSSRAGGGSTDQPRESTGISAARPKKATAMPRSQAIGYPSSSGWSFGPGLSFSSRS